MDPELQERLLRQAVALRKRDRDQVTSQAAQLPDTPEAQQHLEALAQKLALARQAELAAFADALGAEAASMQGFAQREAGETFDRGTAHMQQGHPGLAEGAFQTANQLSPHPDAIAAMEQARGAQPSGLDRARDLPPSRTGDPERLARARRLQSVLEATGGHLEGAPQPGFDIPVPADELLDAIAPGETERRRRRRKRGDNG